MNVVRVSPPEISLSAVWDFFFTTGVVVPRAAAVVYRYFASAVSDRWSVEMIPEIRTIYVILPPPSFLSSSHCVFPLSHPRPRCTNMCVESGLAPIFS